MKCQGVNTSRKILFCLVLLFLGLMSASVTHAETSKYVTQWGSYGSGNGHFNLPSGIAVDSSGKVYVADLGKSGIRIVKLDSNGNYLTQWDSSSDGQFKSSIAVDFSGNVYVADTANNRILKFAPVSNTDATLSALAVSSGSLVPVFSPGTLTYTDSVDNSVSSITFTPKANESHATIKVNGNTVLSGQVSQPISLVVGSNIIKVNVTAQDGITQKTYNIKVTRAAGLV